MSGVRHLAALLFLAGALRAQSLPDGTVSVIHVPKGTTAIGWSVADSVSSSAWEVSVTFDAEHCDIYCAVRRKRDVFGRAPVLDRLLPPLVSIQIYTDSPSPPPAIIVDPAG